jgi:hypothetical protein
MLRASPVRCDRGMFDLRRRSVLELLACIRVGTRTRIAVGLLACFALEGSLASARVVPPGLTVHRSTRAVPRRFTVHPNGATVAANQSQRFGVTDAQGSPVAVRWNVSGLGCSGAACGSVDDQGVYRTPSSLPQQRIVILEAVLVSDPNYSVLTQVRLADAVTAAVGPGSAPVPIGEIPQFTAPVIGKHNFARGAELPSLSSVVGAAPEIGKQSLARGAGLPPPSVISAAPEIGKQSLARGAALPPPSVVGAAPVIGKRNLSRGVELSLPVVVGAAPEIGKSNLARRAGLPPPSVVGAAPEIGKKNFARGAELPPLPSVVAALDPAPARVLTGKAQQLTAAAAGKQNVLPGAVLQPLTEELDPVPGAAVSTQRSPIVTYRDGQLTIDAANSTLADVLKLVAEKTGAVIDVPPGAGLERIVEHAGPGRADDVVARLLNGSTFDFVIVGSPQRPHELTQVLLSLHRADTASPPPVRLPAPATSAVLWTPPAAAPTPAAVPYALDNQNVTPPKDPIPPEQLGKMMRERAQQLREQLQQQQPPPQ